MAEALYPKRKKPGKRRQMQKKNRQSGALNKAVTPAIWYSFASASVARLGCWGARSIKEERFYRDATRKPTCGCNGFLNRHGKRIAPLARIHTFFQAALCGFSDSVIRAFTGLLQRLHRAIRLESPQHGEETAFLRIEGNVGTLA